MQSTRRRLRASSVRTLLSAAMHSSFHRARAGFPGRVSAGASGCRSPTYLAPSTFGRPIRQCREDDNVVPQHLLPMRRPVQASRDLRVGATSCQLANLLTAWMSADAAEGLGLALAGPLDRALCIRTRRVSVTTPSPRACARQGPDAAACRASDGLRSPRPPSSRDRAGARTSSASGRRVHLRQGRPHRRENPFDDGQAASYTQI